MGTYFFFTGFSNHPLYLWFAGYSIFQLGNAYRSTAYSRTWTLISLILDNFFTIAGIHITGEAGTFLFFFLIHISFGYGVRFGRVYLLFSLLVSSCGILILYSLPTPWHGNLHFALAYSFGMPFIALYVYYLVQRIRTSKDESERNTREIRRLLLFVAHDIRTPLHALLSTLTYVRGHTNEDDTRARLARMEDTIKSLARMVTDIVSATGADTRTVAANHPTVTVVRWLLGIVEMFRDDVISAGTTLHYDIDMDVCPSITLNDLVAERILYNALSNAVRFTRGGWIRVTLHGDAIDKSGTIRISITNRSSAPPSDGSKVQDRTPRTAAADHFSGANLGLTVIQGLASAAGGHFSFDRLAENTFSSRFTLPSQCVDTPPRDQIVRPVVLISRDAALASTVIDAMQDRTNVIVFHSVHYASNQLLAHLEKLSAVVIDNECLNIEAEGAIETDLNALQPFGLVFSNQTKPGEPGDRGSSFAVWRGMNARGWLNLTLGLDLLRPARTSIESERLEFDTPVLSGVTALVVDDNHMNCALLREGLRDSGIQLSFANTIEDALHKLKERTFDAVILDWNIGTRSATELVRYLTRSEAAKAPAIFALSAETAEVIRAGVSSSDQISIIEKPATTRTIERTISRRLQLKREKNWHSHQVNGHLLFDLSIYGDLIRTGTSRDTVASILGRFVNEVDRLTQEFSDPIAHGDFHRRPLLEHSIKSVCHAGGAYELGTTFDRYFSMIGNADSYADVEPRRFIRFAQSVWTATRIHIDIFCLSLREADEVLQHVTAT